MDKQRVARELVRLARELTADSDGKTHEEALLLESFLEDASRALRLTIGAATDSGDSELKKQAAKVVTPLNKALYEAKRLRVLSR